MNIKKHYLFITAWAAFLAIMMPVTMWAVQTYVLPTTSSEHKTEHLTDNYNRNEALRSCFSGTAAPTSPTPVNGQCWYDSTNHVYKRYINGSWKDIVTYDGTQTLTNKTLTSPVIQTPAINAPTFSGTYTFGGSPGFNNGSAALPSINFSGGSQGTDGFFSKSATQIGEAINAVEVGFFDSNGNQSIIGTYQSTKACATNHARSSPDECVRSTGSGTTVTIGTTCTTIDMATTWSIPSSAKAIRFIMDNQIYSGTATGGVVLTVVFYSNSGCTTKLGGDTNSVDTYYLVYNTLTSAGTLIGDIRIPVNVFNNGATTIYAKKFESLPAGASTGAVLTTPSAYYE